MKKIIVHRKSTNLDYYEGDKKIDSFNCVVGNDNKTTLGNYKVLLKEKDKHSQKYNAPMPFSLKFSSDYKAIHGTGWALVRSFAQWAGIENVGSHGCVGLSNSNAETLFNWATVGTIIQIIDD